MKKENLFLYILRISVTLLLITGLVAAALAGVNNLTKDAIAENREKKTQQALAQVLPQAEDLQKLTVEGDAGVVTAVYKSGSSYAVEVAPMGFGGQITMMVGIADGAVVGVSVVSHAETSGLGAVAAESSARGEAFRSQFVGQSDPLAVGDQIDSISGATITSKAVTDGVNAALEYVKNLG